MNTDQAHDALVIGAGMAGTIASSELLASGHRVRVLDKGRTPGGRMASRRSPIGRWDYGAQYITARTDAFRQHLERLVALGAVAPWRPRRRANPPPSDWYVGTPSMRSIIIQKTIALPCRSACRVHTARYVAGRWVCYAEDGSELGRARSLVLTAPAPQAIAILGERDPIARQLRAIEYAPTWALLIPAGPHDAGFDVATWDDAETPLCWLADDGSKPGRERRGCWIAHASTAWSKEHLEDAPEDVAATLRAAAGQALGVSGASLGAARAHRWRYARVTAALDTPCVNDHDRRLVIAGDGMVGARVEGAFLSGRAAAQAVASMLAVG